MKLVDRGCTHKPLERAQTESLGEYLVVFDYEQDQTSKDIYMYVLSLLERIWGDLFDSIPTTRTKN